MKCMIDKKFFFLFSLSLFRSPSFWYVWHVFMDDIGRYPYTVSIHMPICTCTKVLHHDSFCPVLGDSRIKIQLSEMAKVGLPGQLL